MTSRFEGTTKSEEWVARRRRLALVTAPYVSNPNLAAQAGVFTLDRHASRGTSLEDVIGPIAEELRSNAEAVRLGVSPSRADPRMPMFRKLTAPHAQSVRLLRLLAYQGVTAAMVLPGPTGVVQAMRDRRLVWERDALIGGLPRP